MATPTVTRVASSAHDHNSAPSHSGTFDPADWLARYTALGGVYVANGKLNLCVLVNHQSEDELSQVREMIAAVTDDEKTAILAHLRAVEAGLPMGWNDVVARYMADSEAFTNHTYSRTHADDPDYDRLYAENNALMDTSVASLRKVFTTPAPDYAAVLRKIAIAAYEYGDEHNVLGALMTDMERLAAKRADADSEILAAWERRTAAYERYDVLPISDDPTPGEPYTPEEAAEWAIIDEAEEAIAAAVATTPRGVAIQLWTALRHCVTSSAHEEAVHRRDLAALEADAEELDGQGNWLLAAIKSLQAMEA